MSYLIQPKKYKSLMADEGSKAIMEKTVDFFENMGKQRLLDDYTFFVTNYRHKAYELKKNVISHQEYVSNFALHDYPVTDDDILSRGPHAWDSALNTVNIGKFNIGPASNCAQIMLIKAVPNPEQYNRVWETYVSVLNGEYAMNE